MGSNIKQFTTVRKLSVTRIPKAFISLYVKGVLIGDTDRPIGSFERRLASYAISTFKRRVSTYSVDNKQVEWTPKDAYHCREYILEHARGDDSIIVLCDGVSRTLTLINFWELIDNKVVLLEDTKLIKTQKGVKESKQRGYVAIGDKTEIFECLYNGKKITFISYTNYGDLELADIFESIGDELNAVLCRYGEDSESFPEAEEISNALGEWFSEMLNKWKRNDCGTWKSTASQLSHSIYRRKFLKADETYTRKPELDRLERSALFGGRAEIFHAADICRFESDIAKNIANYNRSQYLKFTENIYRLDITSMYPFIFSSYKTPGKMLYHNSCYDVKELGYALSTDAIICAAVRIKTEIPEYPVRIHPQKSIKTVVVNKQFKIERNYSPSSVKYPIGEFDTVLIGEELKRAYQENSIKAIYEYSVYNQSDEFSEFMTYLIGKREESRINKDRHSENFWKLIGNSFGGRLAMRNRGWKDCGNDIEIIEPWGQWYVCDDKNSKIDKYRAISWKVQRWESDAYSPKGKPIVWAFVCMIGRILMREIRSKIPPGELIQQDTDGMYVTEKGFQSLCECGIVSERSPGKLRLVSTHKHVRFWGPRHYLVDGNFVMSGLSVGFNHIDGDYYIDTKESPLADSRKSHAPEFVSSTKAYVNLRCDVDKSRIDMEGNVKPYFLNNQYSWRPFSVDPLGTLFRGLGDYG